jgi:hypothetical protein
LNIRENGRIAALINLTSGQIDTKIQVPALAARFGYSYERGKLHIADLRSLSREIRTSTRAVIH